jgi:hypothetical protein
MFEAGCHINKTTVFASELAVVVNIYSYSYSKSRNKRCKQTRKIEKHTREIREANFIIYYLQFECLNLPSNASYACTCLLLLTSLLFIFSSIYCLAPYVQIVGHGAANYKDKQLQFD